MTNDFKASKGGYNKPQLTPEQWAEKKQAEKDAVYKLIDDTAVEVTSSPDKFKAFLDTQARMDRYSAANALLIYKQIPEATQLKDFDDWTKEGVKINKGSKSISILEPVEYTKKDGTPGVSYNVKKVFDVSQTNGKRIPAPTLNRDPQKLVPMMLDSAPVAIETVDELTYDNMGALYDNDSQAILVKRGIGDSVAICQCVAQELGHAQLAVNSDAYSRKDCGFDAVCVGYMLCKKYGVDTQNFNISNLDSFKNKEPKAIRAELTKVRGAMNEIHSRVSDEMYRKSQEKSKDRGAR
jgi:hypothetical protein